jgi:enoyl-CoA hydratase/carnithine racemase
LKTWSQVHEGGNQVQINPRAVLISGTGGKAFCAGGDIVSVYHANTGKLPESIKAEFFAREYLMDYSLTTMLPM